MFNFNISSFFGGSSSSGSGLFGSINLGDYRMIKSGSYKKLMKAYYAEEKGTSSSSSSKKSSKSVLDQLLEKNKTDVTKDTTGVSKMKAQADSLKTAAEAFDKDDLFKEENGSCDTDKIVKSVNDFVSKYNSTLDQAGKTISSDVASQIGYMKNMTSTMSKSLAKVGITVGADGKLSVDEEKLKGASMKDVKTIFSGKYSYAADIADKASSIASAALRSSSFYSGNGTWSGSSSSTFNSWG